jgi:acetolactate synthase I/II/III large subunit
MQLPVKMGCAEALVEILESEGVKFIFGHPGEQILPFYHALSKSTIEHVLMRHEQGAAHAADGYARASFNPGVCVASAGPGALNLVMGVATAYKDSVPLLVITADVPGNLIGTNVFQEVDVTAVFKSITIGTYHINDANQALNKIKNALNTLKNGKTGPIHLNFPLDVLQEEVDISTVKAIIDKKITKPETNWKDLDLAMEIFIESQRPLILVGGGVLWAHACSKVREFAEKHQIPVVSTYPARGVVPENHPLSLGMIGIRGTEAANYAGEHADSILALGCRFSERTLTGIGNGQIVHVNIDKDVLRGDVVIQGDVGEFLVKIKHITPKSTKEWLLTLQKYPKVHSIKTDYQEVPLLPQRAIKEIMDATLNSLIINDAGSHTTWVTLLRQVNEPSSLIFSGGFGPMGYGVPAAIGASLARPDKRVVVVVGDGGFQMTSQELSTISGLNLPVLICVINNHSLGIIRQWQDLFYGGPYQVELKNPDFLKLAQAYGFEAERVDSPNDVFRTIRAVLKLNKPVLIDVLVDKNENIPLP